MIGRWLGSRTAAASEGGGGGVNAGVYSANVICVRLIVRLPIRTMREDSMLGKVEGLSAVILHSENRVTKRDLARSENHEP